AAPNVVVALPVLPAGTGKADSVRALRRLLHDLVAEQEVDAPLLCYYTPQALAFSDRLPARAIVYDCMDELSAFLHADPSLPLMERALLQRANLVFTGGYSLYDAKRPHHRSVHPFPSGVDVQHFLPARGDLPEPDDQAPIAHPRLGFYGVIDERLDRELLASVADARPDW